VINKLNNKVAIVTGAASGIGKGIAIRYSQEGAKVAIVDINIKEAKNVAKEISKNNGKAIVINADITKDKQVDNAVDKVIRIWGKINILINNAGIGENFSLTDKNAVKKWKKVIETNLHGTFFMTEAVAKEMIKNSWKGSIISITSVHSQVPGPQASNYLASKAGLLGTTKCWALELAPYGIRVNAIAPGAIKDTRMNKSINDKNDKLMAKKQNIPLGRHGLPEEIADAAVFLATNKYITGHELVVDGGFLLTH
jgi:NAD(P)-dependent dehydrogenase (short-subunit alcohol dehydrogenase family)